MKCNLQKKKLAIFISPNMLNRELIDSLHRIFPLLDANAHTSVSLQR